MRKRINNKIFDTDSAELLATYKGGSCVERLFRKRTGQYFLHGIGNEDSSYAVWNGNSVSGGEQIIPMTEIDAKEWASLHLTQSDYDRIFNPTECARTSVMLSLPTHAAHVLKKAARERGMTASAVVARLIMGYLK